MQTANKKAILIIALVSAYSLTGCTDWKKKYEALNVEHQNLRGLLDRERSEKGQLAEQVTLGQQTIEDLQRQAAERSQTPAEATGFTGQEVGLEAAEQTITITLPNTALFNAGKADLKKSSYSELDHIVSVLNERYPARQIDVVGHTDSQPIKKSKWKDNWELSAQRALSVTRYLIQRGIAPDKIRAIGRGESQPIASNAAATGRAKNRRVEIVVHIR